MTKKSPLTAKAAFLFLVAPAIILTLMSCTQDEPAYLLTSDFAPVGKFIDYSLQLNRVGTVFENGEPIREIEFQIDADIHYKTQEILPGDIAVVLEKQKWDMDKTDSAGKVTRSVESHTYRMHIKPNGKIDKFEVVSEMSSTWARYVRQYYEQGMPIFPSKKIKVGHSWTQSTTVELETGEMAQAGMTYTLKGTARKQDRDCVILEYKGLVVLPYYPDSEDSTEHRGHDQYEMNGIQYIDYNAGLLIGTEERRRIISNRRVFQTDKWVEHISESDEMVSIVLEDVGVE